MLFPKAKPEAKLKLTHAKVERLPIRERIARIRLWRCVEIGEGLSAMGRIYVRGPGHVRLGARVTLDAREAPIELHALDGAEITIGDDVVICGGTSIEAQALVTIGSRVRIGRFCKVIDNHFHQVHGNRGVRPSSKPVVIEDDVTLGARVIVLSGAVIGSGSTIHAASVISRRVPAGSVMMGVPAMVVRRLAAE